jgi:hypothetical protein
MTCAKVPHPFQSQNLRTTAQERALSISFRTLIYYNLDSLQLLLAQPSVGLNNAMVWRWLEICSHLIKLNTFPCNSESSVRDLAD